MTSHPFLPEDQKAWNEAYDRLMQFLNTFALGDHAHVSRLALKLLDEARQLHLSDTRLHPTTLTMEQAQKFLAEWLATNLQEEDRSPSGILATGYIALLMSRMYQTAPAAFLVSPLAEDLRQSLRKTLLVAGPDLNISSMTPRHLDYGPMLHLARQTWHRFDLKAVLLAIAFWVAVYSILYWWLIQIL